LNDQSLFLALLLFLSMAMTFFLTPRFIALVQRGDNSFTAINYEGKKIVTAGGMVLLPAVLLSVYYYSDTIFNALILLVFLGGLVVLGLVDDLQGDKGCKGFRGHLGLLWREKKISTGLLKALGGFALALFVATATGVTSNIEWLVKGILLALFANLFNLLDTRPAMAIKAFYLLSMILMLFGIGGLIFLLCGFHCMYIFPGSFPERSCSVTRELICWVVCLVFLSLFIFHQRFSTAF
jgi:UDP-N-acetylmuramyl pentapeptide phosphotransferase/UDP-N-acetylglucosamine-1-phosphate transferase